jgi:hydrogenase nickel incorporation protein HypA/HybF
MHEWSLVHALLQRVTAEAAAREATAVTRIRVRIGDLAGVERELFRLAFASFRERTPAASAELDIVAVAARWACPRCGEAPAAGAALRCGSCSLPARLVAGDEIVLDRVEMEVP